MGKMINGFEKSFFKNLLMIALLCSLLATMMGCGGNAEADLEGTTTTETARAKYTVLVYLVGSNLESGCNLSTGNCPPTADGAASADLAEMANVGSTSDMNVVVETGGAKQWANSQISNTTAQRWLVKSGSLELKQDMGSNLNMGDPDTLQDFIEWGIENYPADKYVLVMWDHGGGAIGNPATGTFGLDENNNGDGLSLPEIKQALRNAYIATATKFELFGFDACLMANLETAYTVSPYAGYFVASEEVEPGHGWDYTAILSAIKADPEMSGNTLGQVIADGYQAHAESENPDSAPEITLSVIDLSKISNVITNLESLAVAAGSDLESTGQTAWIPIATGRSKAEDYGNDKEHESYTDMADLKHVAQNLTSTYSSQASALVSAINEAVVYKVNGAARPNANGISIFLPLKNINKTTISDLITAYDNINFSATWRDFVRSYSNLGNQDDTAPTFVNESLAGDVYSAQVQGGDVDTVYGVITQSDPSSGTVMILGLVPVEADGSGNISYTWNGQWVTMNGNFVSMNLEDEEDEVTTYTIPALLNGEGVNILVMMDNATGNYSIMGAWPGIENGVAAREITAIKEGDVITPMFMSYDLNNDTEQSVQGTAFTVGASGLELSMAALPDGTYNLGFIAEDYAQNEQNSQFVEVTAP